MHIVWKLRKAEMEIDTREDLYFACGAWEFWDGELRDMCGGGCVSIGEHRRYGCVCLGGVLEWSLDLNHVLTIK